LRYVIGRAKRLPAVLWLVIVGKREALGRNRNSMAVAPKPDNRGAVAHADEPGASVPVHHGLIRLKDEGRAEPHLQELRAGDRVKHGRSEHAPKLRQDSHSSFLPETEAGAASDVSV
jgi:hypothetical protein